MTGANAKIKRIYVGEKQVRPPLPIPSSGLLGYRPLQSNLNDESGNGKNASWYSGTGNFGTIGGKTGAICTTSSSSPYSSTQHIITPLTYNGTNISLGGWVYFNSINSAGDRPGLLSNKPKSQVVSYVLGLRQGNGFKLYFSYDNGNTLLSSKPNIGEWYCWMVTATSSTVKFYLNGNLTTTASVTNNGGGSGNVWKIGVGTYSNGQYAGLNGYARYCAIYNRTLTDAEVLQFYNNTK